MFDPAVPQWYYAASHVTHLLRVGDDHEGLLMFFVETTKQGHDIVGVFAVQVAGRLIGHTIEARSRAHGRWSPSAVARRKARSACGPPVAIPTWSSWCRAMSRACLGLLSRDKKGHLDVFEGA